MSIKYLFALQEINQYQGNQFQDFQYIKPSDSKLVKATTYLKIATVNKKHGFDGWRLVQLVQAVALTTLSLTLVPLCFTSYRECVSHAWTRLHTGIENIALYMDSLKDECDHRWLLTNSELGIKFFAQIAGLPNEENLFASIETLVSRTDASHIKALLREVKFLYENNTTNSAWHLQKMLFLIQTLLKEASTDSGKTKIQSCQEYLFDPKFLEGDAKLKFEEVLDLAYFPALSNLNGFAEKASKAYQENLTEEKFKILSTEQKIGFLRLFKNTTPVTSSTIITSEVKLENIHEALLLEALKIADLHSPLCVQAIVNAAERSNIQELSDDNLYHIFKIFIQSQTPIDSLLTRIKPLTLKTCCEKACSWAEEADLSTLEGIFKTIYQVESKECRLLYFKAFNTAVSDIPILCDFITKMCTSCTDLSNDDHIIPLKAISLGNPTLLSTFFKTATEDQINWLISDLFSNKTLSSIQSISEKLYLTFKLIDKSEVTDCLKKCSPNNLYTLLFYFIQLKRKSIPKLIIKELNKQKPFHYLLLDNFFTQLYLIAKILAPDEFKAASQLLANDPPNKELAPSQFMHSKIYNFYRGAKLEDWKQYIFSELKSMKDQPQVLFQACEGIFTNLSQQRLSSHISCIEDLMQDVEIKNIIIQFLTETQNEFTNSERIKQLSVPDIILRLNNIKENQSVFISEVVNSLSKRSLQNVLVFVNDNIRRLIILHLSKNPKEGRLESIRVLFQATEFCTIIFPFGTQDLLSVFKNLDTQGQNDILTFLKSAPNASEKREAIMQYITTENTNKI